MFDKNIVILFHLYYKHTLNDLKDFLSIPNKLNVKIVFNLINESQNKNKLIILEYKEYTNNEVFIIESPNIGKDIGGKLALIDLCLKLNFEADFYVFLHDKKSPHTMLGDLWREKLFRIVESHNISNIVDIFNNDSKIGIVAAKEFIMNEFDKSSGNYSCTSNQILKKLIAQFGLQLSNYDFVGGTMFWIRSEIINDFFTKYSALQIRSTLEEGNVLDHENGSNSHAWERMLSWIAIDKKFKIKGV